MIRAPLSITSVVDETTDVVRTAAAPWAAILIATSLPYRVMQILFIERVAELGTEAQHYGYALTSMAWATLAAFLVSLWGRAVWARACSLAESRGATPGREAFRVPLAALGSLVFTGAIGEILFYTTPMTIVGIPLSIAFSGLAVGTFQLNEQPGVREPLRRIGEQASKHTKTLFALLFVFFIGLVVAFVNLYALFAIGLWASRAFGGFDVTRWSVLLNLHNRHFLFLLIAGAVVIIEPFWVAANVMLVRKAGAAASGEDLRFWFQTLRGRWER